MTTTASIPKRGRAESFDTLPNICPNCTGFDKGKEDMGTTPAGKLGHWWRHRLTGFHGVQCGRCGYLIEVARGAAEEPKRDSQDW